MNRFLELIAAVELVALRIGALVLLLGALWTFLRTRSACEHITTQIWKEAGRVEKFAARTKS